MILLLLSLLSASIADAKFYQPENLPEKPNKLERAVRATVRISNMDSGHCSGVILSKEGYVLTNLHCMFECFEYSGYLERYPFKSKFGLDSAGGNFGFAEITNRAPKDEICKAIGASMTIWELDAINKPQIVALGKGLGNFKNEYILDTTEDFLENMATKNGDWAILKYKPRTDLTCLPIARAPFKGTKLWGLGYPAFTQRKEGFNSDGHSLYETFGQTRSSIEEDPYLHSIFTNNPNKAAAWDRTRRIWNQDRFLLGNLDTMPGISGGPLVDEEGRLIAVTFGVIKPSDSQDLASTSLGYRVSEIFEEVEALLGEEEALRIFACEE